MSKFDEKNEDDRADEYDYDNRNPWNQREKKSQLFQYVLLAVLCLILAYALSNAVH